LDENKLKQGSEPAHKLAILQIKSQGK